MMIHGFDVTILLPAFVAGLVVLSTHVPLGLQVIKRGIIFIDLAVAQIAGLGIIIAYVLGFDEHGLVAQSFAVVSALLGAWLLGALDERMGEHQEAIIGISFILAASAGILLLANNPHGGEHLREMLVGQILWVQWSDVLIAAAISVSILFVWLQEPVHESRYLFYLLFAIAVTVSVQLVGVYLVFASLIIPALAVTIVAARRKVVVAFSIGAVSYLAGLSISSMMDLPSGALIVWSLAVISLIYVITIKRSPS